MTYQPIDSGLEETSLLKASYEPKKDYGWKTSLLGDNDINDKLEDQESGSFTENNEADELALSNLEKSVNHNITLSWSDISTIVNIPGKRSCFGESIPATQKTILRHVDGAVSPGSLLAILGCSGSGKSTLLNVLTSRNINNLHVTGEVRLNGVQAGESLKKVSAYVQQDDLFMDVITVREQLQFRALLQMDSRFGRRERLARVEEVIKELGLTPCANSRIGMASGSKRGISGGERKRLSFACEVLNNPPIFFCDEPTSGLDSFMAYGIVETLQKMAWNGRTILCTIHQPSSEVFAMFSQVLLLSEGRTAFIGPAEKAMDFFASQNHPCPENFNPADHYILTLSIAPGQEVETRKRANAICDAFRESDVYNAQAIHHDLLKRKSIAHDMDTGIVSTSGPQSRYESSIVVQLGQLAWRAWITQARRPLFTWMKLIRTLVVSLYIGLTYLQLEISQKGIQNFNGVLYALLVNTSLANMFPILVTFPGEMDTMMRDYGSAIYGIGVYYVTKSFSELVGCTIDTLLFTTLNYWIIGFRATFEAYVLTCLAMVLFGWVSTCIGYSVSIVAGSARVALAVNVPFMVTFMIFGGFFLNDGSAPDYLAWIKHISMFRYAYQITMITQWKDINHIECDIPNFPDNGSTLDIGFTCPFTSGQDVLNYQNIDQDDRPKNFAILAALFCGFYLFALTALVIRGRRAKN